MGALATAIMRALVAEECYTHQVFAEQRRIISENFDRAAESKNEIAPHTMVTTYLAGTPFMEFFSREMPIGMPVAQRLEHTVIVAGSGHGKTQTLEAIVCNDLLKERPPGLVVVDSKGDMVRRIAKMNRFNPDDGVLRDKLIIIDPRDGPHLSPFDVGIDRLQKNNPDHVEEVVNGIISELNYFFRALLGSEISGTMSGVFNPLIQLLVRIPGANLETLAEAVDDPTPFISRAADLPDIVRRFLETQYKDLSGRETRNAVKRRIYMLLTTSPSFARMFNAPNSRLDLAEALNDGKTVLVSTETNFLHDFSPLFGRYIISQTMAAARKRAPIAEADRMPAYIFVDEAGDYFDERTETMLRTLRSYKVGGVLAFQDFGKVSPSLQSALSSSTSIRLAGGKMDDFNFAAHLTHCTPQFVASMRKVDFQYSDFACYIDRVTPRGVSLRIPHGVVDKQPPMTEEQYARLRALNKIAMTRSPAPAHSAPPPQAGADRSAAAPPPRKPDPTGDSDEQNPW
jgi:hypothetical protein